MDIGGLLILPIRVFYIFSGFTFTDIEDFGPILTLIIGLCGAANMARTREKKCSVPLNTLMLVLCLWPILPNIGLYLMAIEFQTIRGVWPQVMADDPKNWLGDLSPRFDHLFDVVDYLQAFSGAWMAVAIALFIVAKSRFSRAQRHFYIFLTLSLLFLLLLDPGELNAWWLD